jgi:hypothetical protein
MSLNGSGIYVVNSAGQPVVANTLITSAAFNAFTADIATALSTAIFKDGQATVTANIPFGGFKLTGVGAATARTDAATIATIQDATGVYVATVGGTADAITLTPSPAITSYAAGQVFWFLASGANTTAVTVTVSGIAGGAKAVKKNGTTALVAGDIASGAMTGLRYDGTNFQLAGAGLSTYPIASQVILQTLADAKGDMIVASGADAWAKQTAGTNGTYLAYDTNQTNGVQARSVGMPQHFRLSLTTAVPVTTADVTAAGTLYCVPYTGNAIALYDGTSWNIRTSAEFSLALTATSGKPYDVWVYDNAGTPTLETLVWTNDTTRATALATQNGILVKSGDATRRYVGTFYANGSNTTEDSAAKRYLWNYYNRIDRLMLAAVETANTWTYTTAAFRQANANTANQLSYIQGVSENPVKATVYAVSANSGTSVGRTVGIGVDSTTVDSSIIRINGGAVMTATHRTNTRAFYVGFPGVGRHDLLWLEYSQASNITTWVGDGGDAEVQTRIMGKIRG